MEDREDVLFVVLEILDAARRLDRRAEGALEPVGVELRLVAIELLGEGDDGLAIQRMGSLTLQVSENPPELPKMSDIIIQTPPPSLPAPRPANPRERASPAAASRPRAGENVTPFSSR